jgi:hypothetical protein
MKHWRMTDWLVALAVTMVGVGFFLPWAKVGASFDPKLASLAESMSEGTASPLRVGDIIGLDPSQWAAALHQPLTGASGLRLFFELRDEGGMSPGLRYFVSLFLGNATFPEKAYLVLLFPALILVPLLIGLRFVNTPKARLMLGTFLLLEYLGLRWWIAATEASRLAVDLRLGLGFWCLVFAALAAALIFFLRAVFPQSRVI